MTDTSAGVGRLHCGNTGEVRLCLGAVPGNGEAGLPFAQPCRGLTRPGSDHLSWQPSRAFAPSSRLAASGAQRG